MARINHVTRWEWRMLEDKLRYAYGINLSDFLNIAELCYEESSKTSHRVKRYFLCARNEGPKLIATIREDGSVAPTLFFLRLLLSSAKEEISKSSVVVDSESAEYVGGGRSVFAGHVIMIGERLRPGIDVPVLSPEGKLLGVGKLILPRSLASVKGPGVVVRIREHI